MTDRKDSGAAHPKGWFGARLTRHLSELMRLSVPVVISRIGIVTLSMVDVAMVGHYASRSVAYLGAASSTMIVILLASAVGLFMGTLVITATAYGRGDFDECGQTLRRSVFFALLLGLPAWILCLYGDVFLAVMGQPPDVVEHGGRLIGILGLGLAPQFVFFACIFFMEGVKKPMAATVIMIAANVLNVGLNYVLVFGHLGFEPMGADGSAWATSIIRWISMVAVVAVIWWGPAFQRFGVRVRKPLNWPAWAGQRRIGYAAAAAIGAEVIGFSTLQLMAGWLGTEPLAAYTVISQVFNFTFMFSAGIATATSVRVGIAFGRGDRADTILAGWTGFVLATVFMSLFAVAVVTMPQQILGVFTNDPAIMMSLVLLMPLASIMLILDAQQNVLGNMLRGLGESWWPTAVQATCYIILMIGAGRLLSFTGDPAMGSYVDGTGTLLAGALLPWGLGLGIAGLIIAPIVAHVISITLQGVRFDRLTRHRLFK